jgi:kinesin family protein 18/19
MRAPTAPYTSHYASRILIHTHTCSTHTLSLSRTQVFGPTADNAAVFSAAVAPLVDTVIRGCNASVFAFGATSAGKTHTMLGTSRESGMMGLAVTGLFRRLRTDAQAFSMRVAYAEVYNESVFDLVRPKQPLEGKDMFPSIAQQPVQGYARSKDALGLLENSAGGVEVKGLCWHPTSSAREVTTLLRAGNANRSQSPTDANKESSRSHAVLIVRLDVQDALGRVIRRGKLSMTDLAGSEQYNARHSEGASINKSLLALSRPNRVENSSLTEHQS